jgi:hypothetical protein
LIFAFSGTKKSQNAWYDGVLGQIVAEKEGKEYTAAAAYE